MIIIIPNMKSSQHSYFDTRNDDKVLTHRYSLVYFIYCNKHRTVVLCPPDEIHTHPHTHHNPVIPTFVILLRLVSDVT